MGTYFIGYRTNAGYTNALSPARTWDIRAVFAGTGDGTGQESIYASRHLVAANQKIVRFWFFGKASTGGTNGTCSAAAYVTNSSSNVAGAQVTSSKATLTTSIATDAWRSVDVDIDLSAYVGQYIKPCGGYSVNYRLSYFPDATTTDSYYQASDTPSTLAATTANGTLPLIYMEIADVTTPVINDVNGNNVVRPGDSVVFNTSNMSSATSATFGSSYTKNIAAFFGSSPPFSGVMPDRVDGQSYPGFGPHVATIIGASGSPTKNCVFAAKTNESYQILNGTTSTSGFLAAYFSMSDTDQLSLLNAAALGVSQNTISPTSALDTDFEGKQIIWHWNHSDGKLTQLNVTTAAGMIVGVSVGKICVGVGLGLALGFR